MLLSLHLKKILTQLFVPGWRKSIRNRESDLPPLPGIPSVLSMEDFLVHLLVLDF